MKHIGIGFSLLALTLTASAACASDDMAVSLHVKNEQAPKAFEKFFGNLSLKAHPYDLKMWDRFTFTPVTVDIQNGNFWQVMAELNRQTGVTIGGSDGDEVDLSSDRGIASRQPTTIVGPLQVSATSATFESGVDLWNGRGATETCTVGLAVQADPRYRAVSIEPVTPATGVKKQPAVSSARTRMQPSAFTHNRAFLQIVVPGEESHQPSINYRGEFQLVRASRTNTVSMAIGGENHLQRDLGDFAVEMSFHPSVQGFTIDVTLNNNHLQQKQWQQITQSVPAPALMDGNGRRYRAMSGAGGGQITKIKRTFNYQLNAADKSIGQPRKVLWTVPVELKSEPITIDIKNLPLP